MSPEDVRGMHTVLANAYPHFIRDFPWSRVGDQWSSELRTFSRLEAQAGVAHWRKDSPGKHPTLDQIKIAIRAACQVTKRPETAEQPVSRAERERVLSLSADAKARIGRRNDGPLMTSDEVRHAQSLIRMAVNTGDHSELRRMNAMLIERRRERAMARRPVDCSAEPA